MGLGRIRWDQTWMEVGSRSDCFERLVAQVSKPAVSPTAKSAWRIWKPAPRPTWNSALRWPLPELFLSSCNNITTSPQKQKTYGRFFGTIFFGAANSPEGFASQQLVNAKNHQNVKKCKIKCFFLEPNPRFSCQNAQKTGPFCCQYVLWKIGQAGLGVEGVQLT